MKRLNKEQAEYLLKALDTRMKHYDEYGERAYTKDENAMFSRGTAAIADDLVEIINEKTGNDCPNITITTPQGDLVTVNYIEESKHVEWCMKTNGYSMTMAFSAEEFKKVTMGCNNIVGWLNAEEIN